MEQIKELRRLAEAATPGEWRHDDNWRVYCPSRQDIGVATTASGLVHSSKGTDRISRDEAAANAAFIAAANPATILEILDRLERAEKALASCQWYWPSEDTSSDACADSPSEIYEGLYVDPGTIIEYSRGGVVETGFYGRLPAADDADSDDDFEVDEPTEEAATEKMAAEISRRAALSGAAS